MVSDWASSRGLVMLGFTERQELVDREVLRNRESRSLLELSGYEEDFSLQLPGSQQHFQGG